MMAGMGLASRNAPLASLAVVVARSLDRSITLPRLVFLALRVNADRDEPRAYGAGFGVQFRIGE